MKKFNELKKINVPTLVIAGTEDIIKESHTKLIAKNIVNTINRRWCGLLIAVGQNISPKRPIIKATIPIPNQGAKISPVEVNSFKIVIPSIFLLLPIQMNETVDS